VHCIDDYLNDPDFDRIYEGELRDRIIRLRNEAEYIRLVLDMSPRCSPPPEAVLSERIEGAANSESLRTAASAGV
jgi:hypothetical protein